MPDGTEQTRATSSDIFISRTGADKDVALVVARILRDAGHTTFLQDEDFGHASFMGRMKEGFDRVDRGARVLALLSHKYMQSDHCLTEAHYPLTDDPHNKLERLIVLRIEECAPNGFLKDLVYVDLVPLLHDADALAQVIRGALAKAGPEANFAALYLRAPTQILHPEIRPMRDFTGREELLDAIGAALWREDGGAAALMDTGTGRASNSGAAQAAVRGMGGVGKSVLAREYGWRNREAYRGVWWVRAETETTAIDDLIELGSRLVPGLAEVQEHDRALHLALDAIMQSGTPAKPWLIVYDNGESPAALARLTPATSAHALITSRWSDWLGHAEELPVDVFPPKIAADYLMNGARHPDREAAARLADALGCLPLALSHARGTCRSYNWSFDAYRAKLPELIRKELAKPDDKAIVYATFDLAITKVAETHPAAERLMAIAAFLAPDRIPLALFTDKVMSEEERDDAVAALANVSLIEHETLPDGARAFTVHRLVQEVMRSRLGETRDSNRLWALLLTSQALIDIDVEAHLNWPYVAVHLPHALRVLGSAPDEGSVSIIDDGSVSTIIAGLCDLLGRYLHVRADYGGALALSRRSLAISEKTFGSHDLITGAGLNNLANLYRTIAHYDEAEPLYRRSLAIFEQTLGPNDPTVAQSLNNLANLLRTMARHREAEPLHRRALAIRENVLGSDHLHVGESANNLANLLRELARYEEAEPLVRRALSIRETALGSEHPEVANSLSNLAGLLRGLARQNEAEPLLRRALAIGEGALGPDHPDVAKILNNLAALLCDLARPDEAEPLLRRALAIGEATLGPDHPDIGTSLNNLAELLCGLARPDEAEPFYQRAVAILQAKLGPDHPTTKATKSNYNRLLTKKAEREHGGG